MHGLGLTVGQLDFRRLQTVLRGAAVLEQDKGFFYDGTAVVHICLHAHMMPAVSDLQV